MALFLSFPDPQNSKGHWLSHCIIKGASCAEFQPHLFYYFLLIFGFIFVIYLFISSVLSAPFLLLYILHIFVLSFFFCFLSLFLPIIIFHSCLFLMLCFPFMSHIILSSLLPPHQSYFNLFQLYLCFHPFFTSCKSKRRFPSHVVMRRAE